MKQEKIHPEYWILTAVVIFTCCILMVTGVWSPITVQVDGVDPICYFSYLHSIIFDGDLHFANEYDTLNDRLMGTVDRTPRGYPSNAFSIGPAVLLSPAYLLTHLIILSGNTLAGWDIPADGFSYPYQFYTIFGLMIYGWIGLLLTFAFLKELFKTRYALAATLIIYGATNLIYYCFPLTLMPHSLSFFAISLFMLHFIKKRDALTRFSVWQWALSGGLLGLATLVRWQNVLFVILPMMIFSNHHWDHVNEDNRFRKHILLSLASFILLVALVFMPQMIAWRIINGSFLTIPQGKDFLHWTQPALIKILFSTFNGLFTWHPITAIALVGCFLYLKKDFRLGLSLIIIFCTQYYLNATVSDWHGSWGFGMRRFVNCMPIFALGIAALLEVLESPRLRFPLLLGAAGIFIIWNILFLTQFYLGLFPRGRPLNFHEMVEQKFILKRAYHRKWFVNAAERYRELNNLPLAERAAQMALELEPESSEALAVAGNVYLSLHDYERALYYYDRVLAIEERGEWMYGMAHAYAGLGYFDQALVMIDRILKRDKEMVQEAETLLKGISSFCKSR